MISPADWARMSWHARKKYMKRHGKPLSSTATPVTVHMVEEFNQGLIRRCNKCGAWMLDVCHTDHGARYES